MLQVKALTSQVFFLVVISQPAFSEGSINKYTYSSYGVPGLLDLPSARSAERDEIAVSLSSSNVGTRASLTYQASPKLSLTFRYSSFDASIDRIFAGQETLFDRSFDLKYQIFNEDRLRPAVAIGVNDVIGTGVYSAEYIVATKSLSPSFSATIGVGWGRLAGRNAFENPLSTLFSYGAVRNDRDVGRGGTASLQSLFTGKASLFGGFEFDISPKMRLKLEYSPDLYLRELSSPVSQLELRSPVNVGLSYAPNSNTELQAYYLYGSTFGLSLSYKLNPRKPNLVGGSGVAPLPVLPRQTDPKLLRSWMLHGNPKEPIYSRLSEILRKDGIVLKSLAVDGSNATVVIENNNFNSGAQSIGRTMRALSHVVPADVVKFTVIPVKNGVPMSSISIDRDAIEEHEFMLSGEGGLFSRMTIEDVGAKKIPALRETSSFDWTLKPYVTGSYFDPKNPVRLDFGVELAAEYELLSGLVLQGAVRKRILGNRDQSTRSDPSTLPRVRSDANIYAKSDLTIPEMTLSYSFRPGKDLYSRVSFGYLESMFGGVSGETIWKPVDSNFAFGVTVSHVYQREFDQLLGFQKYSVTTGHATLYRDFSNGYSASLDMGRYLAGDWGGTMSLSRRYSNGWEVGAYMTLTNVSFDDFGEGSFDKGIRITVPVEQIIGKPSPTKRSFLIQPILRDGGAKLRVRNPLYSDVRDYHKLELERGWGKFWR